MSFFIVHTAPSLQNSPFQLVPTDVISVCFSFLDANALTRIAQVCKQFQKFSEMNSIWQPLHYRQWNISEWLGPQPTLWKSHYRAVSRVVPSSQDFWLPYWKMGFPNEELAYGKGNNPQTLIDPEIEIPSLLPKLKPLLIFGLLGEHKKRQAFLEKHHIDLPQIQEEILFDIAKIFQLMDENPIDEVLALYVTMHDRFIRQAPLLGWWISNLIEALLRSQSACKMEDNLKIFCPQPIQNDDYKNFQNLLQGCLWSWLERDLSARAFIILNCMEEIKQSQPNDTIKAERDRFFHDIMQALDKIPCSANFEKFADFLIKYYCQTKQRLDLAIEVYEKALRQLDSKDYKNRLRIAVKLALALHKKPFPVIESKEFQIACLPVLALKDYADAYPASFDKIPDLGKIITLVRVYEIELAYPFILNSKSFENKMTVKDLIELYFNQITLCCSLNNFSTAIHTWNQLCRLIYKEYKDLHDAPYDPCTHLHLYELIYKLIDESEEAIEILLSSPIDHPGIPLAKAYALHKIKENDKAILTVYFKLDNQIDVTHLKWLYELSRTNFKATIAYGRRLKTPDQLEEYFMEMLEFHHKHGSYIFNNLAVCLFSKGYHEDALRIIETAESESRCTLEAETYALKSMIHHAYNEENLYRQAIKRAHALNPEYSVKKLSYPVGQLLILPAC